MATISSVAQDTSSSPRTPVPYGLRLAPVPRLRGLLVRWLAWMFRRQMGKVMTPITVVYARFPRLVFRQLLMYGLVESLRLDKGLSALVQTRVSQINGCTFCVDLHEAYAARRGQARAKFAALAAHETSPLFDARERIVLRYADHVAKDGRVPDEIFEALRAQLSEQEIVELTWLCAFTTYLNRLAVPLGIGSDGFCALLPPQSAPSSSATRT